MKVIWFNGNFGNQIFYCAYKDYLKEKYPNENIYAYIDAKCPPVKVEERTNLRIPLIKRRVNTLSFIVFKILGALFRRVPVWLVPKWYCEQGDLNDNSIFIGHSLQVKTFYKNNNSKWLEILEPTSPSTEYLKWKEIISDSPSVCVHLRRGDYVAPGSSYVDLSSTDYYNKAMAYAKTILPKAQFFFFSDDLDYVKSFFKGSNIHYVDCNKGSNGYLDIKLMSLAKVNIMANSTFSYWASYINNEKKTIIYPHLWFTVQSGRKAPDIMLDCENWVGI
jgi:hypothetical protein